ncbi:hypothetical protein SAMN06265376_10966 [Dokdonia pacifica]|uniref:Uncharacterized protein n=2 Tax=Dokdonia pacifica TaxID=1627892 RepID=A0A239D157_9FLAO|nr:hypothetical protein SAMN06265376_10966 [Dokdonia pacifica]
MQNTKNCVNYYFNSFIFTHMKIKNKSLAIIFILAIVLVAINVHFDFIDKTELVNQLLAGVVFSLLISYAFISKEASYLKNFIFFISTGMLVSSLEPIIHLLIESL